MSNINVGAIYQQVMKDVIESSRVDFEEGGVDESVLEELRAVSSTLFPYVSSTVKYPRCRGNLIAAISKNRQVRFVGG